ncbi:MAG: beta-propeller domain-containing protein, partial [Candidatus Bathyarchaeota archaeon]
FQKIDPLFVIDLSEPTDPFVLGKLKIPGYSDYLHPYDENHIIGIGKHTVEADVEDFAWYQGVKISLFDVSNVSDPRQMANYTIGDRGTDSQILRDHKAFLFEKSKNLLVIPVQVAEIDESQYPEGVPPYAHGTLVWQGAYVFNITLSNGLTLRGGITHQDENTSVWETNYWVNRALYIEDVLYTISNEKVKLNALEDLSPIREIEIP